ncbi:MAG: Calx-beta domain-containing protein [Paracoccus sp. (in: a-proteobacteria)]|uniref:Calx-beta domain-containing protein n=1 Tax=Paracoccaceae TaxID=31989 RepID=UPI004059326A
MPVELPVLYIDSIGSGSEMRGAEGSYFTVTLRLSEPPADAVTVDYLARSEDGFIYDDLVAYSNSPMSGQVTFLAGETTKTIQFYARSEREDELDEHLEVLFTDPVGAVFEQNLHSLVTTIWVLDNDGAGNNRALAVGSPIVSEAAGGTAVFTISLSEAFAEDRSFSYTTANGTAAVGSDYQARSGNVTFLAGQTEARVSVPLINNSLAETAETFFLNVAAAHGVGAASGQATILDDDAPPQLTLEGALTPEGAYVPVVVRLSKPAADAVTVDYIVRSGSADRNVDVVAYSNSPLTGTVTFAAGEMTQVIYLYARSESEDERDEYLFVELENPQGAGFGGNDIAPQATVWILDNDGPGNNRAISVSNPVVLEEAGGQAQFTVTLSQPFDETRSFSFQTGGGAAQAGSDFVGRSGTVTFAAGQTQATVAVDLINNALPETAENFYLSVAGAHGVTGATGMATIADDDGNLPVVSIEGGRAEEGDRVAVTLRLSRPATDAVTMDYQVYSGTGSPTEDLAAYSSTPTSGTVTFAAGETSATVYLYVRSERTDELDESFFVEVTNPVNASFENGVGTLRSTVWALDNDGPSNNRTLAVSDPVVRETGGQVFAVFTVEMSRPHDVPVSFTYRTQDGTARAGQDYQARNGTLTFAAGQTRAEVLVPILDSLAPETNEQFFLRLDAPFPSVISASTGSSVTGTATIIDSFVRGTNGGDVMNGTAFADRLDGRGGNDVLRGFAGNDYLLGGAGNDTLIGAAGVDTVAGGAGNDSYFTDAADRVVEFANGGFDTILAGRSVTLGAYVEGLQLLGGAALNGTGNGLANRLAGNGNANRLNGGAGNDTLIGNGGNDTLLGGTGNDRLLGNVGNDVLVGGNGFDTLNGGLGADRMEGGFGDDLYFVDNRFDRINEAPGGGFDTVRSTVSHTLTNHVETLILAGNAGLTGTGNGQSNRIVGNAAGNLLNGAAGADTLQGGAGNDRLLGGAGNDRLFGDRGADRLIGNLGSDTLTGGDGADTFVFSFLSDSRVPFGQRDVVTDFRRGQGDHLDLSGIDADPTAGGNQRFDFIGSRGFTGNAGDLRAIQSDAATIVLGDVDGDRMADFAIQLNGRMVLLEQDFFL